MTLLSNTLDSTNTLLQPDKSRDPARLPKFAKQSLQLAAQFWFLLAVIGQWIFVFYLTTHFGAATLEGDLKPFNVKTDDLMGNIAIMSHILLAVIVFGFGPLQLIPAIRQKFPVFHRWNGRVYLSLVLICTLTGFYMMWARTELPGGNAMKIALNLMVALTLICAFYTLKTVLSRQIKIHRQWALRLFMMVSAGWFFRVGLMAWIIVNGGPVGFDPETFEGPFIKIMAFAQYLIPLAILEIYLRVKESHNPTQQLLMTLGLVVASIVMGVGIFGASMGMWLTHL